MAKRKGLLPPERETLLPKKTKRQHSAEAQEVPSDQQLVIDLNAKDAETFEQIYIERVSLTYIPTDSPPHNLTFKESGDLKPAELNACFKIVETTSRADYESSSLGWHPDHKRAEMLEPDMRYMLIRRQDAKPAVEKQGSTRIDTSVEGFLSFQICHDSSPVVPVLYIFEIHLAESLRGIGMGSHLMNIAEDVAAKAGVAKTMLTCFVSNERALAFYRSRGYERDPTSPEDRKTRSKLTKADHVIMGKPLVKRAAPWAAKTDGAKTDDTQD